MFQLAEGASFLSFFFLGAACFCAAFVDAIAGGGGLISLPAFLASGLPAHIALGSNKVAACCSAMASSAKFAQSGKVNWALMKKLAGFSFIGAVLGVKTVVMIDSKYLYPIAIVLLMIVLLYSLYNKNLGEENRFEGLNTENVKWGIIMAFSLGFYDGFFGPGAGSFLIFAIIRIFKMDFTNASGNAKILNLASNVASVIMFVAMGKVNFLYSVVMALIMVAGATLGARMAVTKGSEFIKPVLLTVTTIVLSKMVAESVFNIDVVGFGKNIMLSLAQI